MRIARMAAWTVGAIFSVGAIVLHSLTQVRFIHPIANVVVIACMVAQAVLLERATVRGRTAFSQYLGCVWEGEAAALANLFLIGLLVRLGIPTILDEPAFSGYGWIMALAMFACLVAGRVARSRVWDSSAHPALSGLLLLLVILALSGVVILICATAFFSHEPNQADWSFEAASPDGWRTAIVTYEGNGVFPDGYEVRVVSRRSILEQTIADQVIDNHHCFREDELPRMLQEGTGGVLTAPVRWEDDRTLLYFRPASQRKLGRFEVPWYLR